MAWSNEDTISYVMRYGGFCRECADEHGVCPSSGMPCDTHQKRAVVQHTLSAVAYGLQHGFLPASAALTAASAIDGDYNAGVEDAAQIAERDGQSSLAAEIRKLKKVTP